MKLNRLTPKKLAFILAALGLLLAVLLFYPVSQILNGSWKLEQQIYIATIDTINVFGYTLPIGAITIRFYAICILLGLLAGYALAIFLSKWQFIAGTVVDRLFIGLVIFGIIGARLLFVVFHLSDYQADPLSILYIFKGGLAIFGMLIAGALYVWVYCARFKFNFFEFTDFLAPSILIGQIIGRFGNFFNYEAYGGPTRVFWKMFVPETANFYSDLNEHYFHPTFLYEIIPNFFLLIFLLLSYERLTLRRSGLVFAWYAIGYGGIRAFTEFFRLDALKIILPDNLVIHWQNLTIDSIMVSQVLAICLALLGFILIYMRSRVVYVKKTMAEFVI